MTDYYLFKGDFQNITTHSSKVQCAWVIGSLYIENNVGGAPDGSNNLCGITNIFTNRYGAYQSAIVASLTNNAPWNYSFYTPKLSSQITSAWPGVYIWARGFTAANTFLFVTDATKFAQFVYDNYLGEIKLAVQSNTLYSGLNYGVIDAGSYWRFYCGFVVDSMVTNANSSGVDDSRFGVQNHAGIATTFDFNTFSYGSGLQAPQTQIWGMQLSSSNKALPYQPTSDSLITYTGSTWIEVVPEYGIKFSGGKIEQRSRSEKGVGLIYKYGSFESALFDVRYTTNSDAQLINSWWRDNTKLRFANNATLDVVSSQITGDTRPISNIEKPYFDKWLGTINLETY